MIISEKMYFSSSINEKKQIKYLQRLSAGKNIKNVLVVAFRINNTNLFEIMTTRELYRLICREQGVYVVAVTATKDEAAYYIGDIICLCDEKYNNTDKAIIAQELGINE